MTHATRALQSHDLSGERIKYGSYTYFFEHTRTWRTSPEEGSAHFRDNTNIHAPIHSNKANIKGWLWQQNDIRGPCVPKASWHLFSRWDKTSMKTSPRKLVSTGDRSRARCVTDGHATACSKAVDWQNCFLNVKSTLGQNGSGTTAHHCSVHAQPSMGKLTVMSGDERTC